MSRIICSIVAILLASSALALELSDSQRADIEARIAPVGEVCMQGDNSCGGAAVAASSGPRSGEDVYNSACMACHTTGAGGAPMIGDATAWADRIAGVPGTGMIAKGGCMQCSDEEIHAAVDYMVAGSQ